ncbi:hypothetical protein V865_001089 [Kwoniella europaea PYCC6329]|uniref:Uncharacterized protein n=1 Tax=Kwoniella europaea PYCC6329 TaxID=1423913 RepID=A0AAX4KBP6_9TREE
MIVKAAKDFYKLGAKVVEKVSIHEHTLGPDLSLVDLILGESNGRRGLAMNDLTEKLLPLKGDKVDRMF